MNLDKLIEFTANHLNGIKSNIDSEVFCPENQLDEYKLSVIERLINTWDNLNRGVASKTDFEITLRDFLLVFQISIKLHEYQPSENFSKAGLFSDDNGEIFANYNIPEFVNSKFVKKCFMNMSLSSEEIYRSNILVTNGYIKDLTGFDSFKTEEQKLCVFGALKTPMGCTTLVSMSTGGGKSLITQTVSYQQEGSLTIIVVPTISLMLDQAKNANAIIRPSKSDEIVYYNSDTDIKEISNSLKTHHTRMLFISPEALIKNPILKKLIIECAQEHYLQNFIVDEAHIILEWGASFRVDFQCLDAMRKVLLKKNPSLRTFLLSATFSSRAVEQLKVAYSEGDNWIEIRCDKLRKELLFDVVKTKNKTEKYDAIVDAIFTLPHPMIIYVNSPDDADSLKNRLIDEGFSNIQTFTGRTGSKEREKLIIEWADNKFNIMIATCAFGVGVDKKDVRTVLHAYIPENPNKYYQEAGRGGRDGLPSLSEIIYTQNDVDSAFSFLQKVLTIEKLSGRWFSLIGSSKATIKGGGKIIIDTSVVPYYNDDENVLKYFNGQDVNWNVYTILLLRRNKILSIEDVSFENNKYIFTVQVEDRRVLHNNDEAIAVLTEIREREWKENEEEFRLIKRALTNCQSVCWSEMFNKIYTLTDSFCAGCNAHNETIDECDNKVLRKSLNFIYHKSADFTEFFQSSNNLLILGDLGTDALNKLIMRGVSTLICTDIEAKQITAKSNATLCIFSYDEFFNLANTARFLFTGTVMVLLSEKISDIAKFLDATYSITKSNDIDFIFIGKEDSYIPAYGKKLSEIINGPCKKAYIIEEVL